MDKNGDGTSVINRRDDRKRDPYSVLGVSEGASDVEVRRAYFARVHEHPPERDPDGFKTLREAYEKLRNPRSRAGAFLDEFQIDFLAQGDIPEPEAVPLSRLVVLLAAAKRFELFRTQYDEEEEWSR